MAAPALLLIDIQKDYFPGGLFQLDNVKPAAANAARLLAATRAAGWPVIHVRHVFPNANAPFFAPGSEGAAIHPIVEPWPDEPIIIKAFPNAFRETLLAAEIDARKIDEVVIVGAMSHVCVDATARAAADRGLAVTVVHDAIATRAVQFGQRTVIAADVHAAFMGALAFGIATVSSVADQLVRFPKPVEITRAVHV